METFSLQDHEYIALNSLLKLTGLCPSGGLAKQCIADGQVEVDGEVERRKRYKVRAGQTVMFEGQTVRIEA